MKQFANPHLYARGEAIWAAANLVSGALLLEMAVVGVVLGFGLWRLRRWSRWLALGQAGLLVLAGGVITFPLLLDAHWKLGDAAATMLPGFFLGLVTLLLWSPRFADVFAPAGDRSVGSRANPPAPL